MFALCCHSVMHLLLVVMKLVDGSLLKFAAATISKRTRSDLSLSCCLTWSHKSDINSNSFYFPPSWGKWAIFTKYLLRSSLSDRCFIAILSFNPYHNLVKWGSLPLIKKREEMRIQKTKRSSKKVPNTCLIGMAVFGPSPVWSSASSKDKCFHGSPM